MFLNFRSHCESFALDKEQLFIYLKQTFIERRFSVSSSALDVLNSAIAEQKTYRHSFIKIDRRNIYHRNII